MILNLVKKTFLHFTLLSFLTFSANAFIPELFDGADQGIEEIAKGKELDAPRYLMPSERFMMMQVLKNIRFDGNLGLLNKELELPFNLQGLGSSDVGIFPQDARSALLGGCLFPSPDGVTLLANQAASDILSTIQPGTMGTILRTVHRFIQTPAANRDAYAFKMSIYSLLLGRSTPETPENFRQLGQEHKAFLQHDFESGFSLLLPDVVQGVYDAILEKDVKTETENPTIGNMLRLIDTYLESHHAPTITTRFKDHLGEFPTFDELDAMEEYSQALEKLKKLKQHTKLNDTDKALQKALQEKHKVRLSFEERRPQFRALGFVETLSRAIVEQEQSSDTNFIYPDHMVEQTLMTYFWLKAGKIDDIADFYGAFFEVDPSHIKPHFSKSFDRNAYVALKERILSNQISVLTPEILSAAAYGFNTYENPLPLLPQFQKAYYTPKTDRKSRLTGSSFPDCVETSVRNAVYIHAHTKKGDFYESDVSLLKLTPQAVAALEQDPFLKFSQDAHDRWGSYLTEIQNVQYSKPPQQKDLVKRKYELHPGWFNTLRVWAYLLGDRGNALVDLLDSENDETSAAPAATQSANSNDDDNEDAAQDEDETSQALLEKLNKGFSMLSALLSREDHKVEIVVEGDAPEWEKKFSDFTAKIKVSINGVKTYNWAQDADHSAITYEPIALNDWRLKLTSPIPATVGVLAQAFLPPSSLAIMPVDLVRQRFWTLDFSNRDVLLEIFEISLKKTGPIWEQIQKIILRHVKGLEDASTENLFGYKILMSVQPETPLPPERVEAIFRTCPSLLESVGEIDYLPRLESGALAKTPIKMKGQLFSIFYDIGYKNLMDVASELMERVLVRQNDIELINTLGEFKKPKVLDIESWNREMILSVIQKLPARKTFQAINFPEPATAAEGIEVMKAFLEKFPENSLALPIEGKEHLKDLEVYMKSLEQKVEDQFLLKEGHSFKPS